MGFLSLSEAQVLPPKGGDKKRFTFDSVFEGTGRANSQSWQNSAVNWVLGVGDAIVGWCCFLKNEKGRVRYIRGISFQITHKIVWSTESHSSLGEKRSKIQSRVSHKALEKSEQGESFKEISCALSLSLSLSLSRAHPALALSQEGAVFRCRCSRDTQGALHECAFCERKKEKNPPFGGGGRFQRACWISGKCRPGIFEDVRQLVISAVTGSVLLTVKKYLLFTFPVRFGHSLESLPSESHLDLSAYV